MAEQNAAHQQLAEGAAALGYHYRRAYLNIRPDRYDFAGIAYSGFGDQTGAKQGTLKTFLQDAVDAGARIYARTKGDRILVEEGRAVGVQATYTDPDTGETRPVHVRARQVVAACGALETPALLLRSGIGGPDTGHHLHLHPVGVACGMYDTPQDPWLGPGQAGLVDDFLGYEEGYGFLVEGSQHALGLFAGVVPWQSARVDKDLLLRTRCRVDFICLVQDRGSGRVTIDERGEAVHHYPISDELDRKHFLEAVSTAARIHAAAGAEQIFVNGQQAAPWRRGEDLEEFLARITAEGIGFGGLTVFSAHPSGSARMGTDPRTSVAGPTGELHDTQGVWIGDTSIFPTSSGVNPMVTCMSLARRTAHAMIPSDTATRSSHGPGPRGG